MNIAVWDKVKLVLVWFYQLGSIFLKQEPFFTLGILFLTLVSQVSIFLASALPLKVLFLLESSTVPSFFPSIFQNISREYLIFFLSIIAILFFFLHLISEQTVDRFVKSASKKIIESTKKIILFENQDEIAKSFYSKFTRGFAGLFFSILVIFVLSLYYLHLVYSILLYVLLYLSIIVILYNYNKNFKDYFIENFGKISKLFSNIGPLIVFFVIIFDYLYSESHPSLIIAVIGLLLTRQAISKIGGFTKDIFSLYRNRTIINSLFSHTQIKSTAPQKRDADFWSIMQKKDRNIWLSNVITEIDGVSYTKIHSKYSQTSLTNIISFKVNAISKNTQILKTFYIKIFNQNMSSKAIHEASLLGLYQTNDFVSLQFLGTCTLGKYQCHLFTQYDMRFLTYKELKENVLQVKAKLLHTTPNHELLESYSRSHPSLKERFNKNILKFLRIIRNDSNNKDIQFFIDNFEKLKLLINNLPFRIVNPEINIRNLVLQEDNKPLLLSWANWSFEPIGSGWEIKDFNFLRDEFYKIQKKDPLFNNIYIEQIYICAILYEIELWIHRQRFDIVEDLLPQLRQFVLENDLNTS